MMKKILTNASRKETMISELKTLTEPPLVPHLDIGLKGQLHTYHLAQPKTRRHTRKKT